MLPNVYIQYSSGTWNVDTIRKPPIYWELLCVKKFGHYYAQKRLIYYVGAIVLSLV